MAARMTTIKHGTHSGYTQHQHQKVPACDPCLDARRDYDRTRHARRILNNTKADWVEQGNCYRLDDPSIMFTPNGLAHCDRCPVLSRCGDYRLRLENASGVAVPGVWGGEFWIGPSGTQRAHLPKAGA